MWLGLTGRQGAQRESERVMKWAADVAKVCLMDEAREREGIAPIVPPTAVFVSVADTKPSRQLLKRKKKDNSG